MIFFFKFSVFESILNYSRIFYNKIGVKLFFLYGIILINSFVEFLGISCILPILNLSGSNISQENYGKLLSLLLSWVDISYELSSLLVVLLCIFVIKGVVLFVYKFISGWYVVQLKYKLQSEMAEKISSLKYSHFTYLNSGKLSNILIKESLGFVSCFAEFTRMPVVIAYILVYLVSAIFISIKTVITLCGFYFVLILAFRYLIRSTKNLSIKQTSQAGELNKWFMQMLNHYVYLKGTASIKLFLNIINNVIVKLKCIEKKMLIINSSVEAGSEPIAVIALIALIYVQVVLLGYSLHQVMVLGFLIYRLIGQLLLLQGQWQRFNTAVGSLEVIEACIYDLDQNLEVSGKRCIEHIDKTIKFCDVDFYYADKKILDNINIQIPSQKSIGIVGPSGSGKTTLFYLLVGLLEPKQGELFLGDINYKLLNKEKFREKIGYITQDPMVIDATVEENITLWNNQTDNLDKIKQASKLACFESLTHELNRNLGDKGQRFSGGQRQRIAIAREFFKNPELIIFDEATSALDSFAEDAICDSINMIKNTKTVVIISHKLASVQNCDYIYVLNHGRVVQQGTFRELYTKKGDLFNQLCIKQNIKTS